MNKHMIKNIFTGRINTNEFLRKWLLSSLLYFALSIFVGSVLQSGVTVTGLIFSTFALLILIYRLSFYVRRLRSINKNVWISVFGLLPVLDIVLFIALLFDLNKWITTILIMVTILVSIVPVTFLIKVKQDNDISTNSLRLSNCYLLAKDGIYYYELSEFNIYKKLDADPGQFVALDSELCYGKDGNNVYFRDKVLEGENPDTFVIPEEIY